MANAEAARDWRGGTTVKASPPAGRTASSNHSVAACDRTIPKSKTTPKLPLVTVTPASWSGVPTGLPFAAALYSVKVKSNGPFALVPLLVKVPS